MRTLHMISAAALVYLASPAILNATVLTSDRIAVGVAEDGSLGDSEAEVGLRFDPDGAGGAPGSGDVLLPGRTWEVWSVSFEAGDDPRASFEFGRPELDGELEFSWQEPIETASLHGLRGAASTEWFDVDVQLALSRSTDALWIDVVLRATEPLTDVWISRAIDLDLDAAFDTYATDNQAGDGFAASASTREARAFAMVAEGVGTVCSDWCSSTADLRAPSAGAGVEDSPIGVAVALGDISAGESVSVRFVYALASSNDAARAVADDAFLNADLDGDGVETSTDCEDLDPRRAPGLVEIADGVDNDCDGDVDEDTSAVDDDGDGYTEADGDCDDEDPATWPGAPPSAGVRDADCDGLADDGWTADTGTGTDAGLDTAGTSDAAAGDASFGGLVDGGQTQARLAGTSGCAAGATRPLASPLPLLPCLWALFVWRKR